MVLSLKMVQIKYEPTKTKNSKPFKTIIFMLNTGLLLLISPWKPDIEAAEYSEDCVPCQMFDDYWFKHTIPDITMNINSSHNISSRKIASLYTTHDLKHGNLTDNIRSPIISHKIRTCPPVSEPKANLLGLKRISAKYSQYVGYMVVFVGVVFILISANILRHFSMLYSNTVLAFWNSLNMFTLSLFTLLALYGHRWPIPNDSACRITSGAFITSETIFRFAYMYVYRYLPVSYIQIGEYIILL